MKTVDVARLFSAILVGSFGCIGGVLGAGERALLSFSVAITNTGLGDAVLPGPSVAPELYEFDDCHRHHHVSGFASYDLVGSDGKTIVSGRKQGYRLADVHKRTTSSRIRCPCRFLSRITAAYVHLPDLGAPPPHWAEIVGAGPRSCDANSP